jgi:hypothetical protein
MNETPDVALRVASGWLVGSDRGEWGGELIYLEEALAPQMILHANVVGILEGEISSPAPRVGQKLRNE